jgi:hypothetical protein
MEIVNIALYVCALFRQSDIRREPLETAPGLQADAIVADLSLELYSIVDLIWHWAYLTTTNPLATVV